MRYLIYLFSAVSLLIFMQHANAGAYEEGLEAYKSQNYEKAVTLWSAPELSKHPEALYSIGVAYASGNGVNKNRKKALLYYQQASDLAHSSAQFNLGLAYYMGKGIEKDLEKAEHWWRRAAKQDHVTAQYNLAALLWSEDGELQDQAEAMRWFRMAMIQGSVEASEFLYTLFEPMYDDLRKNHEVYRAPEAERSIPLIQEMGMFKLGMQAMDDKEFREAYNYWLPLANDGHLESQYMVAKLLESGALGGKNLREAINWYEKAANAGQVYSQYRLGMYHFYESSDINKSLGAYWMQSAADQGFKAAIDFMNDRN